MPAVSKNAGNQACSYLHVFASAYIAVSVPFLSTRLNIHILSHKFQMGDIYGDMLERDLRKLRLSRCIYVHVDAGRNL